MRAVAALLAHHWHRHRLTLVLVAAGLLIFEWVITRIAPSPTQTGAIEGLLDLLPAPLMTVFGNEIAANLNPRGFVSFGYTHPFALILLGAWAVRVSAGALAGEMGRGTMDLLAARAVPRWAHVTAAFSALAVGLAVIAGAGWVGTAWGLAGRPEFVLAARAFAPVAAMLWLLFVAFGAVGLLVSASRRTGGAAIAIESALLAISFAVDYLARAWAPIGWLRPASLFMYFRPVQIAADGIAAADAVVLGAVTLTAIFATAVVMARRDL